MSRVSRFHLFCVRRGAPRVCARFGLASLSGLHLGPWDAMGLHLGPWDASEIRHFYNNQHHNDHYDNHDHVLNNKPEYHENNNDTVFCKGAKTGNPPPARKREIRLFYDNQHHSDHYGNQSPHPQQQARVPREQQ